MDGQNDAIWPLRPYVGFLSRLPHDTRI